MEVFQDIGPLREYLEINIKEGSSIGLIPTMGSLHQGHEELIHQSLGANEISVCSIFVNPEQFNDNKDLDRYPRSFEDDLKLLEKAGCQCVFAPGEAIMYPSIPDIGFRIGEIGKILEGEFRPGHFNGVILVVCKLLNIVQPHRAYFGEKDLQQLLIIKKMVSDLNFPVEVVPIPTVRDKNGLALSSRNERLTVGEKARAAEIFHSLQRGFKEGKETGSTKKGLEMIRKHLNQVKGIDLEYVACLDLTVLQAVESGPMPENFAFLLAGYIAGVRLIDNIIGKMDRKLTSGR